MARQPHDARTSPDQQPVEFERPSFWTRWFGSRSERAAEQFLRRLGHTIIARNSADRQGEIDLITLDGEELVIVEVRSLAHEDPTRAAESVNHRKQRKITDAALRFLSSRGILGKMTVRFDILAISWPPDSKYPNILHLPNAFDAVGRHQMFS